MYKPPQNNNRVRSLKNKFENLEKINSQIHHNICDNDLIRSIKQELPEELPTLQRQTSDPLKMNIKRTPAFRVEKSVSDNCDLQKCSFDKSVILERKRRLYSKIKNNCDNSNGCERNDNTDVTITRLAGKLMTCKHFQNSQPTSEKSVDYKHCDNISQQQSNVSCERENVGILSNLYTEPIPKALRKKCNKTEEKELCDIHIYSNSGNINENVINSELLTDTLKIALKKPLPLGPAPRKPPRTFQHFQNQSKQRISIMLPSMKDNESGFNSRTKSKQKKSDAKYMLNKLENALKNNKLNVRKQNKKTDICTTSGEDSDDGKNEFNRMRHISCQDEDNLNSTFNFNCLSLMNCSRSECERFNQQICGQSDHIKQMTNLLKGKDKFEV